MSFIQIDWSWIQWFNCFQLFYSWATTNVFSLPRFVFRLAFPRLCSLNPFVLPYRTDIGLVPIHQASFSLSLCLWLSLLLLFVIVGRLAWGNNQYKVECGDLCVNVKTSQKCCQQLNWIGLNQSEWNWMDTSWTEINELLFANHCEWKQVSLIYSMCVIIIGAS